MHMEGADGDAPATVGSGNVVPDTARMVIGGGLEPRAPARAQTIENEVMGSARGGLEGETLTSDDKRRAGTWCVHSHPPASLTTHPSRPPHAPFTPSSRRLHAPFTLPSRLPHASGPESMSKG